MQEQGQTGNWTVLETGEHQPQPVIGLCTDRGALAGSATLRFYSSPASGWGFWACCPNLRHVRRPPSLLPTDSVPPPILLLRRRLPLIISQLSTRTRLSAFEASILNQVRNEPHFQYKKRCVQKRFSPFLSQGTDESCSANYYLGV